MSMDNNCNFIGRLGKDPEVAYAQSGTAIATLTLAVDDKRKDSQGNWQKETVWVRAKAFGKTAELLQQYTSKGSQLALGCKYQTGKYQDKTTGQDVYTHDFIVNDMKFLGGAQGGQGGQQQPQQQGQQMPPAQPAHQAQNQFQQPPQRPMNDFDLSDDVPF